MRQLVVLFFLVLIVIVSVSFTRIQFQEEESISLRRIYSEPTSQWPRPFIDEGVSWQELGLLPESPLQSKLDSLKHLVELGKVLFFDSRLSGSGSISCASCHQPELSWTDGKIRSVGHAGATTKRNAPSIQNSWFYKKLFWDGRSRDLEDQSFGPINSETEMHGNMPELVFKLRNIKGYAALFDSAYGDPEIGPDRIAKAIATFERTIISPKSRFDEFLSGKRFALNNSELKGLHLFRTKARCMNCHNGPMFSDNQFHNVGFHLNGNPENDPGLYNVTHKESDQGKFKTPSLRDVMKTGPWMHQGLMNYMPDIIAIYSKGAFYQDEPLIKMLSLTQLEQRDLIAFLEAISAEPLPFKRPRMPE